MSDRQKMMMDFAAMIGSKTVFAPFERIKMMLQLRRTIKEKKIKTTFDEYLDDPYSALTSSAGIYTLCSGLWIDIVRPVATQMLNYAVKARVKEMSIFHKNPTDSNTMKFCKNVAAGGFVGGISLLFLYPLDMMKTEYILGIERKKKWNLKSLYRGFGISIFGIFVYRGLYFGLYDTARAMQSQKPSYAQSFMTGYIVTVIAGLVSYPIGTVGRRQLLTEEGPLEAATNLVQNHGWMSLWDAAAFNICLGMVGLATKMMGSAKKS